MIDLTAYSAPELARAIRYKEVSALEAVASHLCRIEIVNTRLNAVVNLTSEAALAEARRADDASYWRRRASWRRFSENGRVR